MKRKNFNEYLKGRLSEMEIRAIEKNVKADQEEILYKKLMDLLCEMIAFDNLFEQITHFSVLTTGIASEIEDYERNKAWAAKRAKKG